MLQIKQKKQLSASFTGLKHRAENRNFLKNNTIQLATKELLNISSSKTNT